MNTPAKKLKILFLTAPVADYLPDSLLIGLRNLYGENCVDFPRKSIMYGDVPSSYGRGFTMWSRPIRDIPRRSRNFRNIDLVIYSSYRRQQAIDWRLLVKSRAWAPRVIYLDGEDDTCLMPGLRPYFKRELLEPTANIFPIGFGIPERHIRPLNVESKTQLHQTHVQDPEFSKKAGYVFAKEGDYYDDLARSYFGITMKKGGWDCMRHYEIMAAGTLVMFKHFDQKPAASAPQCSDFVSYSSREDFMAKTARLLPDGKPGAEYINILQAQRAWLLAHATCTARAEYLIRRTEEYFADKPLDAMPNLPSRAVRRARLHFFLMKAEGQFRATTFLEFHPAPASFHQKVVNRIVGLGVRLTRPPT